MHTKRDESEEVLVRRAAFPRRPESVGPARRWAARVYEEAGGDAEDAYICRLLVSELATNAVLHAEGDRFEVTVWASLGVGVTDGSPKLPSEPAVVDDDDENGRGLPLVYALSARCDITQSPDGKTVRFWLGLGAS